MRFLGLLWFYAVPLNLAGLNVYRELFEPILKDRIWRNIIF
jgi:hypothetical protein